MEFGSAEEPKGNVSASGAVVQWLEKQDHDVAQVITRDERVKDNRILAWAVHEERITRSDF